MAEAQQAAAEAATVVEQQHEEALAAAVMAERRRAEALIGASSDPRLAATEDETSALVEAAVAATRQKVKAKYDAMWHVSMAGVHQKMTAQAKSHEEEKQALQAQLKAAQREQGLMSRVAAEALEDLAEARTQNSEYSGKLAAAPRSSLEILLALEAILDLYVW